MFEEDRFEKLRVRGGFLPLLRGSQNKNFYGVVLSKNRKFMHAIAVSKTSSRGFSRGHGDEMRDTMAGGLTFLPSRNCLCAQGTSGLYIHYRVCSGFLSEAHMTSRTAPDGIDLRRQVPGKSFRGAERCGPGPYRTPKSAFLISSLEHSSDQTLSQPCD